MKAARIKTLYRKYLAAHLPRFVLHGDLILSEPIEYLARGFCFESSGTSANAFYPWVYVQPLYLPEHYTFFTFGERLTPGEDLTETNEDVVMRKVLDRILKRGLPFLNGIRTPGDLAQRAGRMANIREPGVQEVIAYSLVLAGEFSRAKRQLDRMLRGLEKDIRREPKITWLQDIHDRGTVVKEALERDPQAAVSVLEQWRLETIVALKLV